MIFSTNLGDVGAGPDTYNENRRPLPAQSMGLADLFGGDALAGEVRDLRRTWASCVGFQCATSRARSVVTPRPARVEVDRAGSRQIAPLQRLVPQVGSRPFAVVRDTVGLIESVVCATKWPGAVRSGEMVDVKVAPVGRAAGRRAG